MKWTIVRKLAKYGLAALLSLVFAACGIGFYAFQSAKSELAAGSLIADTTVGPIEYVEYGAGPAVALVHGTPGGYDQFNTLAKVIADGGYRVIVFSRPGYLRTPISVGDSVTRQAAALDALRAHLMIPKLAVVGVSGGGPSSLKYAADYPDRISALALIAALSGELPLVVDDDEPLTPFGFADDMRFFIGFLLPDKVVSRLGPQEDGRESSHIDHATRSRMTKDLFGSLGFSALRNTGYLNDARQFYTQKLNQDLSTVRCPTLLIYGKDDNTAPVNHGELIKERLGADSQLVVVPQAGHTVFITHANRMVDLLFRFLPKDD